MITKETLTFPEKRLTKREAFYELERYKYMLGTDLVPNNTTRHLELRRTKLLELQDNYDNAIEAKEDIEVEKLLNSPEIFNMLYSFYPNAPDELISNIRYYERKCKQVLLILKVKDKLKIGV